MIWLWTAVALAGVSGKFDGKPYEAKAAVGGPGTMPGTLAVTLSDVAMTCDSAPATKPRAVALGFDAKAGATSTQALLLGPKLFSAADGVQATLVSVPTEVGGTGHIVITKLAAGKTSVVGEMDFVLCAPVTVPTPPTATFASKPVVFEDTNGNMKFEASFPDWTAAPDFAERTVYSAPDGLTKFWLETTCDGGCDTASFGDHAKSHAKSQISGFEGQPGWRTQIFKDESPAPGVQVTRFGYGAKDGSLTVTSDVLFWGEGWPYMGLCHAETIEMYASFLDQAEAECLKLRRVE